MAKQANPIKKQNAVKSVPPTQQDAAIITPAGTVSLNLTLQDGMYGRIFKYRRDKGHVSDQEVIRLAITAFLERVDY